MQPIFIDLTKPRERTPVIRMLLDLQPGESYIHDHTGYATKFSMWLAKQRQRHGRRFLGSSLGGNKYRIRLAPTPTLKGVVER